MKAFKLTVERDAASALSLLIEDASPGGAAACRPAALAYVTDHGAFYRAVAATVRSIVAAGGRVLYIDFPHEPPGWKLTNSRRSPPNVTEIID